MSIYVSGSLAYDRIMDFPGRFADHILPEKIHILNVCFQINGLRENFGGTAGNIAYALGLLGEKSFVVATAGRDFGGYRSWLEDHGIPDDHIDVHDDLLTAGAYITTDLADNQITAFNPGAMARPAAFDVDSVDPLGAMAIVSPGNLDDMLRFSLAYHRHGIPYIFDPGQSLPAWEPSRLREAVDGCEILISNDYELQMITEKTGLSEKELLRLAGLIVTTRGEKGSEVKNMENGGLKIVHIPPVPAREVLDPTGAGDAYRAGLIKGLRLPRRDVLHAARMGSACASYAVEVYGTQTYRFSEEEFNTRFRGSFGITAF